MKMEWRWPKNEESLKNKNVPKKDIYRTDLDENDEKFDLNPKFHIQSFNRSKPSPDKLCLNNSWLLWMADREWSERWLWWKVVKGWTYLLGTIEECPVIVTLEININKTFLEKEKYFWLQFNYTYTKFTSVGFFYFNFLRGKAWNARPKKFNLMDISSLEGPPCSTQIKF